MIVSGRDPVKLNMLYVALHFPFLLFVSKNILHPCGNSHWASVTFFYIGNMGVSCDFERWCRFHFSGDLFATVTLWMSSPLGALS